MSVYDTASLYNTGTGTVTIPTTGFYLVQACINTASTLFTTGQLLVLYADQAGSVSRNYALLYTGAEGSGTYVQGQNGSVIMQCVAGDTIQFRVYSDATTTLSTGGFQNYFSISQMA